MSLALEVKNLSYIFSNGTGVKDLSFQIKRGEIYVLYGCHSTGKTVLLQTLIGTIIPQNGTIKLFENLNYNQEKSRVGYVPQEPFFIGKMTISEMLNYFALSFGILKCKFEKVLELDLNENRAVCHLPLSVQRLVNLGIALLGKPDFILMDEPFSGLDAHESDHLLSIISALNKDRNITFLLTDQHYNTASQIASKYGVLANGKILAELTPSELTKRCDRCVKIRTPQLFKAIPILQKEFSQYEILDDDLVRVFCPLSYSSKINTLLVSAGVEVSEIWIAGMNPQEYLSKIAGGESID